MPEYTGGTTRIYAKVTGPAGAAVLATTGVLNAGAYDVSVIAYVDGTLTAAELDNIRLVVGGTNDVNLLLPQVASSPVPGQNPRRVVLAAAGAIAVSAIGVAGGAAVYHVLLLVTPAWA